MINPIVKGVASGFKPDPRLTVTEWAERFRMLTTESSAEAGIYRVKRTPYLKEIMDVLSPTDPTQQVKVIKGTQLGFSQAGINVALTYLDYYPCPILYLMPTETLCKTTSKRIITPSIRACEHLAGKVVGGKSKDDIGEVFTKQVAGGSFQFGWSQSSASFRSFSARVVILDDVDGYGQFGEGNVLSLGKARADAFPNKKIYINSTPTTKGSSNIETEFEDSDQREYFMPCPECNELMVFKWDYIHYEKNSKGQIIPDSVVSACPNCGSYIPEYKKTDMMTKGKWIPQNEGHPHKGYKLPAFYSPLGWLSWYDIAKEHQTAVLELKEGNTELMKVWKNTRCAEPFAETLKGVEIRSASERVEDYGCEVPDEVVILTAGFDTQDDRYEIEVLGHGKGGETWSIDYKVIAGDPQFKETQLMLDDYLIGKRFTRKDGRIMKISGSAGDTGGHRTKAMYDYCEQRIPDNIFGIKGGNTWNAPVTNKTIDDIDDEDFTLITLNVNIIKDDFLAKLKVKSAGNNFCHFPNKPVYNDKYFKMLTAEKKNEKTNKYEKIRARNEALDCRIYAMGALAILDEEILSTTEPLVVYAKSPVPTLKEVHEKAQNNEIPNYLDEF